MAGWRNNYKYKIGAKNTLVKYRCIFTETFCIYSIFFFGKFLNYFLTHFIIIIKFSCIFIVSLMSLENENNYQVKAQGSKCNNKLFLSDDLRLVIFGSALYSLRTTSTLKPYPNEFYDPNQKEIQRDSLVCLFMHLFSKNGF